ncbi:MAG: DegV family protein [Acutalibacteraceae bacterium]|nr:DegV family protein [Acutalibacteraceae bacterium]
MNNTVQRKIKITADSTCDMSPEICEKYGIEIIPLHVVYDSESYDDGVNIFPHDILERYKTKKQLPKTSAVSLGEYLKVFGKYTKEGFSVIHISLGSSISSSHQNSVTAASEFDNVYAVDSQNLSCGQGLVVLKACDLISTTELSAAEIAEELKGYALSVCASFVLDSLEFLRAGGRCSTLAMLGANLLNIKPCIEVNTSDGAFMTLGRKYRGKYDKVVYEYIREKLSQYSEFDVSRLIIVSSDIPQEIVDEAYRIVSDLCVFKDIMICNAGCTITSHCGSGAFGIFFASM